MSARKKTIAATATLALVVVVLLSVSFTHASAGPDIDTPYIEDFIPLDGGYYVAVNEHTNKIYVAAGGISPGVTVIDGVTHSVQFIDTGSTYSFGLAINETTNTIYVANVGDDYITIIDGSTNTTYNVTTERGPIAIGVNEITNKIYVSHNLGGVAVIDGSDDSVNLISPSALGGTVKEHIAVNSVTNKIFVPLTDRSLAVIDGATDTVESTINLPFHPWQIIVDESTNYVYIMPSFAGPLDNLAILDMNRFGTADFHVGRLQLEGSISVDVNSLNGRAYVARMWGPGFIDPSGTGGGFAIIEGQGRRVLSVNAVVDEGFSIAVNDNTDTAYMVSRNGTVVVIHGRDGSYDLITTGSDCGFTGQTFIAANSSANRAFVLCSDGLYVIAHGIPSGTPGAVDSQIASSSDDAYHDPVSWPYYRSDDVRIMAGAPGSNGPTFGGWRWADLGIPDNAVITEAYVELTQLEWGWEFESSLGFEDHPNPDTFAADSSPYDRWQHRTDFTLSWNWPKGKPRDVIRTPDLSAGVQELVDRYGGIDALVLVESGVGVEQHYWHAWQSFEGDPSLSARLHVAWIVR